MSRRGDSLVAGPAPLAGGCAEIPSVERASASPVGPLARRVKRFDAALGKRPVIAGPLEDLQTWFSQIVTHPEGVARAAGSEAELLRRVTAGPRLSALERMGIYHYAYQARLVECLADDYPALRHAMGPRTFERLCREVITRSPSGSPNLNAYGRHLLIHLRDHRDARTGWPFFAELAELEWAMVEVLHAEGPPPLALPDMASLAVEAWAQIRFRPSATVRLLRFTHPVNAYFQAWREERRPRRPRPSWSATAVYRQGFTLWRMDLTRPMEAVLSRLLAGESLGEALAALGVFDEDPEALLRQVMVWFREWVSGGFFAEIDLGRGDQRLARSR